MTGVSFAGFPAAISSSRSFGTLTRIANPNSSQRRSVSWRMSGRPPSSTQCQSRWVGARPKSSTRPICARNSRSTSSSSACSYSTGISGCEKKNPCRLTSDGTESFAATGPQRYPGISLTRVRCTPNERDGSSRSISIASQAQGQHAIRLVVVTIPLRIASTVATLIEWHMPKSSALTMSNRDPAG